MPYLNVEQAISKAVTVEELKVILRQITQAVNSLSDLHSQIHGDLYVTDDGAGIVMKATGTNQITGDNRYVKVIPSGTGTHTISLLELGKDNPALKLKGR